MLRSGTLQKSKMSAGMNDAQSRQDAHKAQQHDDRDQYDGQNRVESRRLFIPPPHENSEECHI